MRWAGNCRRDLHPLLYNILSHHKAADLQLSPLASPAVLLPTYSGIGSLTSQKRAGESLSIPSAKAILCLVV